MIISNSEIVAFNTCQRAHYYRYILGVEPKFHKLSIAIIRGIIGHKVLETFYSALKEGGILIDEAKAFAWTALNKEILEISKVAPGDFELIAELARLKDLIDGYFETYRVDEFRVLETEKFYHTNILPDLDYGLRTDLLVEFVKGPYRGDIAVVDHKFVYNFKTESDILMDGQLPKYVKTIKDELGIPVTKGIFNQIRHRPINQPTPEQLYRRSVLKATRLEVDTIWAEQQITANEIHQRKMLDTPPVRNLNPYVCKGCYFRPLCYAERRGDSIELMLKADYQPNTYGYELIDNDS